MWYAPGYLLDWIDVAHTGLISYEVLGALDHWLRALPCGDSVLVPFLADGIRDLYSMDNQPIAMFIPGTMNI